MSAQLGLSSLARAGAPCDARRTVRQSEAVRVSWALWFALVGHGALVALALGEAPPRAQLIAITEVELMRPPAPVSVPDVAAQKPEPAKPAAEQPRAERRPSKPALAKAAEPARAAPLRTVAETAETPEEPVRFVTDPNGSAFGYGTVARGGAATAGLPGPIVPVVARGTAHSEGPEPLLSRPPSLGESDPCRGFFPQRAQVDRGEVALKVRVEADGSVRAVAIAREAPVGHGFGFAARDCLLSKRFSPALDVAGRPVATLSPVTVKFSR